MKEIPDFQNPVITVKGEDGQFYTVPKEGLQDALAQGFVIPPNEEIQHEINLRTERESNLGALRAFAEEGLGTATFGLSRQIENKLGITTPEEQALIKEAHPVAAGLGTAAGILAPLILTQGASAPVAAEQAGAAAAGAAAAATAAKGLTAAEMLNPVVMASKASQAVTEAVAPRVAGLASGLAQTSPRAANALVKGTAGAMGLATEGALYGVGNQISEDALGDPEALGEHFLPNVGLSTLLGGGLGAIFHGGLGLIQKPGQAVVKTGADYLESMGKPVATFEDAVKAANFDNPQEKKTIIEGLRQLKDHAAQIEEAGQTLGVPVFPGQVSANDGVQKMWQILSDSASPIGQAEKQSILNALKTVQQRIEGIVETGITDSKAQVGQKLVDSLFAKADAAVDSYSSKFKELGLTESAIPLNERSVKQVIRNISRIPEIRQGLMPEYGQQLATRLERMTNMEDLVLQIKYLGNDARKMATANDMNGARIAEYLKAKLERLYESTVRRQFGKADQKFLLGAYKEARREFAQTASKYGRLAAIMGKKRLGSPINFLRMIRDEAGFNADKLADKLFQKENSKFLEFFERDFPEEWNIVKGYQKAQMAEYKDNILNVNKFLKDYGKMQPELKNSMFTEAEQKTLDAAKTYMEAFPDPINPSKTAPTLGWMAFLKDPIEAAYTTARDAMIKAGFGGIDISIKDAPRTTMLKKVADYANKTERSVKAGAAEVFSKSKMEKAMLAVTRGVPQTLDEKEYHDLMDKINKTVSNPIEAHGMLEKSTAGLYEVAPKTAFSVQQKMLTAASFLNSKAPKPVSSRVLSPTYKPSKSELEKFNRYYKTIKQPTNVIKKIKTGMIMPEEMETLRVVYPQLLQQMQSEVIDKLTDHMADGKELPYRTKIGLSVFLEQPLINSLNQQSIAMNQATFGAPTMQKEPGGIKPTSGAMQKMEIAGRSETGLKKISAGKEA